MTDEELRINADFDVRVIIRPEDYQWVASPMPGVERIMLDRIGGEVARATSLVRYEPNSQFSSHVHSGGEEYFVLEGVFADEHGEYPEGTYVRNPIGTEHTPKIGSEGAIIFVKLHQFDVDDKEQKSIDTHKVEWQNTAVEGVLIINLHEYKTEKVVLTKYAPNIQLESCKNLGGTELFVLEGAVYDENGVYQKGSWLRLPHNSEFTPYTKENGALILQKTGHIKS